MTENWWSGHRTLEAELHVLLAAGTLVGGTAIAVIANASLPASVLILTATSLVGSLGARAWAAAVVGIATWCVHTGLFVQARGSAVGPDQVENLVLFTAAAALGWFCGRRAREEEPFAGGAIGRRGGLDRSS